LGVFVLLFGIWYSYKRGREERIKLEQSAKGSHEILVEGAKQPSDDPVDHGDGVRAPLPEPESTSAAQDVRLVMAPVVDTTDTPVQVESEPIPAGAKKQRKSWLRGKTVI
jgi:hypothetical protein